MKRKYYFVILFLVLAIFLSGCSGGGIVTPTTDEAKTKSVINECVLAVNDQDWSKAKSYCVYGSEAYYQVCYIEDMVNTYHLYCDLITINYYINILNVSIYGNYSEVYGYLTLVISACGQFYSDSSYFWQYLQKVGNTWKIYS